jgi:hypothetical protein
MRASTSALDAEDQDQEETPIPGAHNCPPARLFYRTFPSYVYTFFSTGCPGLEPADWSTVFSFAEYGGFALVAGLVGKGLEKTGPAANKLHRSGYDPVDCRAAYLKPTSYGEIPGHRQVPGIARARAGAFSRVALSCGGPTGRGLRWILGDYMLLCARKRRPAQTIPHNPVRSSVEGSGATSVLEPVSKLKLS